jgi:small conductance mechanosensitive channel
MVVLLWLSRALEGRIVRLLAGRSGHGTIAEREDRAKTLASVFHNAAYVVVIAGGILMVLREFVDVVPLMGGVAVIGLAVAFGAQNLIRDYFYGFMILLENQYCINDVVKICGIGGLVERVTLRVTVLRDLEGIVHFIPNGQITSVSNMTHGWSRALFNIGVAYKEDVDQVMKVLVDLGKELRADSTFRQHILDDPEMLGVDSFDDSAVTIKFFIKTRPLQQWMVKRAMLRRIKKKFDELGIEIPFPHRTIFHHYEEGKSPTEPVGQAAPFS